MLKLIVILCWTDVVSSSLQQNVDLVQHFSCLPADHLGPEST